MGLCGLGLVFGVDCFVVVGFVLGLRLLVFGLFVLGLVWVGLVVDCGVVLLVLICSSFNFFLFVLLLRDVGVG